MASPVVQAPVSAPSYCEAELDKLHKSYNVEKGRKSEVAFENMLRLASWINAVVMHMTGRSYQITNRKLSEELEVVSVGLQNTYGGKLGKTLTWLSFAVGVAGVFCGFMPFIANYYPNHIAQETAKMIASQAQQVATLSTATSSLSQLPEKSAESDREGWRFRQGKTQRILEDQSRKKEEVFQISRKAIDSADEVRRAREAAGRTFAAPAA